MRQHSSGVYLDVCAGPTFMTNAHTLTTHLSHCILSLRIIFNFIVKFCSVLFRLYENTSTKYVFIFLRVTFLQVLQSVQHVETQGLRYAPDREG